MVMIEEILTPCVASAEAFGDEQEASLFPEEQAAIANAIDARRREFGTVRRCARQALTGLGIPAVPLLPGEGRAPQWPAGVVGSMTHCAGYRAAAVARAPAIAAVGIDAEPNEPLPPGVLRLVSLGEERSRLAGLAASQPGGRAEVVNWDRLLFCCKEAVYKAWYPLARRWLGFESALISIDPAGSSFTGRLLVPGPDVNGAELAGFSGRWLAADGLLLAAIALPSAGAIALAVTEQAAAGSHPGLEAAHRVELAHHRGDMTPARADGHAELAGQDLVGVSLGHQADNGQLEVIGDFRVAGLEGVHPGRRVPQVVRHVQQELDDVPAAHPGCRDLAVGGSQQDGQGPVEDDGRPRDLAHGANLRAVVNQVLDLHSCF
jgi:4'-phosphopantetheinyl transferase EntD